MPRTPRKTCNNCGQEKKLSEFYHDRSRNDGHSPRCKVCEDAKRAARRAENADQYRAFIRHYRNETRAAQRKAGIKRTD